MLLKICNLLCDWRVDRCGQYTQAAHYLGSATTVEYGLYTMSEIEWSSTCPVSRAEFVSTKNPLLKALQGLEAVMVVSVIIGFFMGILLPIYGIVHVVLHLME